MVMEIARNIMSLLWQGHNNLVEEVEYELQIFLRIKNHDFLIVGSDELFDGKRIINLQIWKGDYIMSISMGKFKM
jgi:hypothetical protein